MNKGFEIQLEELGLTIGTEDNNPQKSNANIAKEQGLSALWMVRAWLGSTVLKDLYRNKNKVIKVNLGMFSKEFNKLEVQKVYTQQAMNIFGKHDKTVQQKIIADLLRFRQLIKETPFDNWGLIRAINKAIGKSNYGNYMKDTGWIYTCDSDHHLIQCSKTGEYKWTEPSVMTFKVRPAITEEEYLKPYTVQQIANPFDETQQISIRVYKNTGSAVKPSSNYSDEYLDMNDPIIKALVTSEPGQVTAKQYDWEISPGEFERVAERDVNNIMRYAEENGQKYWHLIDYTSRKIIIYNIGELEPGEESILAEKLGLV